MSETSTKDLHFVEVFRRSSFVVGKVHYNVAIHLILSRGNWINPAILVSVSLFLASL